MYYLVIFRFTGEASTNSLAFSFELLRRSYVGVHKKRLINLPMLVDQQIHQLHVNTGGCLEDLQGVMDDRDGWWESENSGLSARLDDMLFNAEIGFISKRLIITTFSMFQNTIPNIVLSYRKIITLGPMLPFFIYIASQRDQSAEISMNCSGRFQKSIAGERKHLDNIILKRKCWQ